MTSQTFDARTDVDNVDNRARRLTTETKAAFKTTELIVYVLAVVGVLVASAMTDNGRWPGLRRRERLVLRHPADHRLHDQPRSGQVRQPRSIRRLI